MTKRILTLACILAMLTMLIPAAHADYTWTMYVSPAQGTTVNLRSTPDSSKNANNLITQVPYGTALTVKYISNGWACIDYGIGGYDEAFMMVKYMSYEYVPPTAANMQKKTNNTDTGSSKSSSSSSDLATHYEKMNEQFRSFRKVNSPFTVYGKPERATGWSNLRFAPNEKATLIRKVRQNDMLTVIGETDRWYQVEDPQTGYIGYISRFYVSTNPN